jgi:hypothetical protein
MMKLRARTKTQAVAIAMQNSMLFPELPHVHGQTASAA